MTRLAKKEHKSLLLWIQLSWMALSFSRGPLLILGSLSTEKHRPLARKEAEPHERTTAAFASFASFAGVWSRAEGMVQLTGLVMLLVLMLSAGQAWEQLFEAIERAGEETFQGYLPGSFFRKPPETQGKRPVFGKNDGWKEWLESTPRNLAHLGDLNEFP